MVEEALNSLYDIKSMKSGEAFLITSGYTGIYGVYSYNNYGTDIKINNHDFTNVKSFNYTYSSSTTDTTWQRLTLNNSENVFISDRTPTSNTVEINEATGVNFRLFVPLVNNATFKVNSYTTIDGVVHNFD